MIKSLSKTYKDKLSFGEVKNDKELQAKFGIEQLPKILALTDPLNHAGEEYDTNEMKID